MKNNSKSTLVVRITEMGKHFSGATILMHQAIAQKIGLTGTDHKYLGYILQKGKMTAGYLAEITGLTTGAVTGLIDRLEKKKLVKRVYDKDDRRKVLIEPNMENVGKLLGAAFGDLEKRVLNMLSDFDEKELQVIEKYMLLTMGMMKDVTENIKVKTK